MITITPAGPGTETHSTAGAFGAQAFETAKTVVLKVVTNKHVQATLKRILTVTAQLIVCMVVMGAAGMGLLVAWLASTTWNTATGMTIGVLCSNKTQAILGIDTSSCAVHVDVDWLNDEFAVHVWNVAGRLIERAVEVVVESAVVVYRVSR